MNCKKAAAMSRKQIRRLVEYVRKLAKIEDELFFPILQFVENVLPVIFDDFQFEVVPMEEMGNKHGESFPNRNIIRIREDVYMHFCVRNSSYNIKMQGNN